MHSEKYRYTGDFPPPEIIERFPNWEYALDEESAEGQDETTIRPTREQAFVAHHVAFTQGYVVQADGTRLPAMLEVDGAGITGLTVYSNAQWAWVIRLLGSPAAWVSVRFEWLPSSERPASVVRSDPRVFPLLVESRLPSKLGASCLRTTIARSE